MRCPPLPSSRPVTPHSGVLPGRDPNWGRIAAAAGYAGVPFNQDDLRITMGSTLLMDKGQPQKFDAAAASGYMKAAGEVHGTVRVEVSIGSGPGKALAWGCDLTYDYVKINADYTCVLRRSVRPLFGACSNRVLSRCADSHFTGGDLL